MCFVYFQCLVHNCIFYLIYRRHITCRHIYMHQHKHTTALNVYLSNVYKTQWNIDRGKEVVTSLSNCLTFFVWMEHTDISGTWGAIIVIVLPKQTPSTSCQEDSQVSAHIALEQRGGGTAKPVYPKASGVMWVPVYVFVSFNHHGTCQGSKGLLCVLVDVITRPVVRTLGFIRKDEG